MAENEHDENLIDDIMRGGPNYCLDRIESLETEVSRLQARVAELEAMWVEERAARLWADDIFRYEGHLTWSEVDARTRSHCIEEARAALEGDAPKEDAEYWKARCLLERIAREVRDDDFADDYTIAYEVMDEDTADVAALEGDAPIVCGAHQVED